jgi:hypothetical protein
MQDLSWKMLANLDIATSSKRFRKSSRQNMVRNLNSYDKYIRKHMKEHSYTIPLRALFKLEITILHMKNSSISGFKEEKSVHVWDCFYNN